MTTEFQAKPTPACTYRCEAFPECGCVTPDRQQALAAINHVLDCLLRDSPDEIQAAMLDRAAGALQATVPAPEGGDATLLAAAKRVIAQGGTAWFSEQQLADENGLGLDDTEAAFIALCSPAAVLAALSVTQPKGIQPCKGMNCGATDGKSHSPECYAEHAATVDPGVGERHRESRYAGYKGEPFPFSASEDEQAAWVIGFKARLPAAPSPAPAHADALSQLGAALDWITDGVKLNANTAHLVLRFARALAEKLARAEVKYGYADGWLQHDWMDECRTRLIEHLGKGDPRDVAAYCAFLWHHGESTAAPVYTAQAPAVGADWEAAYEQFKDGPAFPPYTPALKVAFEAGITWQAAQQVPPGWVFEKQAEPLVGHLRIQDPSGRYVYVGADCLDTTERMLFDLATALSRPPVQETASKHADCTPACQGNLWECMKYGCHRLKTGAQGPQS
jgi:hypothetical protein